MTTKTIAQNEHRLPNGAFMQKASCRKWHELSAHRRGIFCPSPNPLQKHMFLTCAFLGVLTQCAPTNDCVCNKMSAPCGLARQQVRSKADFAHPCVESFVPCRKQDVSKCLADHDVHSVFRRHGCCNCFETPELQNQAILVTGPQNILKFHTFYS